MSPRFGEKLAELLDAAEQREEAQQEPVQRGKLVPGDRIHFLATTTLQTRESASMIGGSQDVERGQTVTITQAILDLNRDRLGNSFLDLVDDEEAQEAKYGHVLFRRGPWPEGASKFPRGDISETWERQLRLKAAAQIADEREAAAARARIYEELGRGTTQRSTYLPGTAEREASES